MDDRFEVDLLGRHEWKALSEIKSHLIAENTQGSGARAVVPSDTTIENVPEERLIGLHGSELSGKRTAFARGRRRFLAKTASFGSLSEVRPFLMTQVRVPEFCCLESSFNEVRILDSNPIPVWISYQASERYPKDAVRGKNSNPTQDP